MSNHLPSSSGGGGSARAGDSGLKYPSNGKTIYHRPLNRTKTAELSKAAFAYLFAEMVSYAQRRVTGIQELEKRCVYSLFGCWVMGSWLLPTQEL